MGAKLASPAHAADSKSAEYEKAKKREQSSSSSRPGGVPEYEKKDAEVEVEEEEDEIIESDVELEGDIVEPDNDPPQKMGDPSVKVTMQSRDASQEAKGKAMEAISEGKLEEAIEHLTEAILLNPTSAIMYGTRATVYITMKKPNGAVRDANAALEINPDSAKGYKARGMARAMLGQWGEAAKDLHLASMLDYDEEISAVLKKVEPNAHRLEEHRRKYERLHKEREDSKNERERQRGRAKAQAAYEKAKKREQSSSSSRPGGMPGGFPRGGFPEGFPRAQAEYEKAKKEEQSSSSSRPGGMPEYEKKDAEVEVEEEEDEIIESDVELEGDIVEPDNDPPQKVFYSFIDGVDFEDLTLEPQGYSSSKQKQLFEDSVTVMGQSSSSAGFMKDPEFVCAICVESKAKTDMFFIKGCIHVYCTECMVNYVDSKLEDNITTINCPEPECKGVLESEDCLSFIPLDMFDRWNSALCEAMFLGYKKFYCPFKNCSGMLLDDGGVAVQQAECPHCRRLFCAECKVAWHSDIKCEDFQKLHKDERETEDIMLMNLAQNKNWRRCPSCRIFVERTEGCKYIKCRCRTSFCYTCGSTDMDAKTHHCHTCHATWDR